MNDLLIFSEILVDRQDASLLEIHQFYRVKMNEGAKLTILFIFMSNCH